MAYETRGSTAFQLSISSAESIQLLTLTISIMSILILSYHERLGFPICLLPVGLLIAIFEALLCPYILATCSAHLTFLALSTMTALSERYCEHFVN